MGDVNSPKTSHTEDDVLDAKNEIVVEAIQQELLKWQEAGITPEGVGHNVFAMDVQLQAIIALLEDAGIITLPRFRLEYHQRMLKKLQESRSVIEPQIRQQRITQGIPPEMLLDQFGNPIRSNNDGA